MSHRWRNSPVQLETVEAGGGGDCFFHALARTLQNWLGQPVSMRNLRDELAISITKANVGNLIEHVREDHRTFLPTGAVDWNVFKFDSQLEIATSQAQTLVRVPGLSMQGTDVILRQLLAYSPFLRRGRIGCVVANSFGPGFTAVYPSIGSDPQNWYVVMYCANNAHWQAATLVTGDGARCGVLSLSQLAELLPYL